MAPAQGAYVRDRADELLGIVALESHRAEAVIMGEDLGTVEAGVRERLETERILACRVLWLEDKPPAAFPVHALASITTHDLRRSPACGAGAMFASSTRWVSWQTRAGSARLGTGSGPGLARRRTRASIEWWTVHTGCSRTLPR